MGFKVVTWNINGLRSFGGAPQWRKVFEDFQADLVCFQETKIPRSSVEEWMACVDQYSSYFAFPRGQLLQSGYSGVATYCSTKCTPVLCEVGLFQETCPLFQGKLDESAEDIAFLDAWFKWISNYDQHKHKCNWKLVDGEGRCVVTKHTVQLSDTPNSSYNLFLFNVYCPRNDSTRPEREHFQLRFYHLLQQRACQLLRESDQNLVMIVGDYNVAHQSIDVVDDAEFSHRDSNGRKWITEFLDLKIDHPTGQRYFVDAFRHLNPTKTKQFSCWNTMMGCRATNYGTRIDYIVIDNRLMNYLTDCHLLTEYIGSDHCPVVAQFDDRLRPTASTAYPFHCTRLWPEFVLQQSSIRKFLSNNRSTSAKCDSVKQIKKLKSKQTNLLGFVERYSAVQIQPEQTQQLSQPTAKPNSQISQSSSQPNNTSIASQWRQVFEQTPAPLCSGHGLPCVRRKVKKAGNTQGREFWSCSKASLGTSDHPDSRCNFFRWTSKSDY